MMEKFMNYIVYYKIIIEDIGKIIYMKNLIKFIKYKIME